MLPFSHYRPLCLLGVIVTFVVVMRNTLHGGRSKEGVILIDSVRIQPATMGKYHGSRRNWRLLVILFHSQKARRQIGSGATL